MKNLTSIIAKKMEQLADESSKESERIAAENNSDLCKVCGGSDFVQKFRNVVGEISGSMHGYYSLFGGSISSRIDGNTKTLPILSCRNCENEREIETWEYTTPRKVFWYLISEFYFSIKWHDLKRSKEIDSFFLEHPVETRAYMLENKNWEHSFYNDMPNWSTEIWAQAGFKIPKIKKRFLFWEWEQYADWEDLTTRP